MRCPRRSRICRRTSCSARMAVPDPDIKPGEGPARVCLSMKATDGSTRYRQFRLELLSYDEAAREVQVHLSASQPLTAGGVPAAQARSPGQAGNRHQLRRRPVRLSDDRQHAVVGRRADRGVVDGAESERAERGADVFPSLARQPQGQAVLRRSDSRSGAQPAAVEPATVD